MNKTLYCLIAGAIAISVVFIPSVNADQHLEILPSQHGDLKAYRNKQYGYEVKYPANWRPVEARPYKPQKPRGFADFLFGDEIQKITFMEEEYIMWPGHLQISVLPNRKKLTLQQWVNNYKDTTEEFVGGISDITVNKVPAKKVSIHSIDSQEFIIIILKKEYVYQISFEEAGGNDPELDKHKNIYNKIISSFTFIE